MKQKFDKDNPPKCECGDKAVLANAGVITDIPYWYCRKCKIEVYETGCDPDKKPEEKIVIQRTIGFPTPPPYPTFAPKVNIYGDRKDDQDDDEEEFMGDEWFEEEYF